MGCIYSYKLKYDDGFAPNPYHGFLTLATCKPGIRQKRGVGDWIAGWTANRLFKAAKGDERLIYLMRVSKKMPLDEYFLDPRFKSKIPNIKSKNLEDRRGDNIYEFLGTGDPKDKKHWKQHDNDYHDEGNFSEDIRGEFVLIAEEFYYFGENPIVVDKACRPNVPFFWAGFGHKTCGQHEVISFVEFVKAKHAELDSMPRPHGWNEKGCCKSSLKKSGGCSR